MTLVNNRYEIMMSVDILSVFDDNPSHPYVIYDHHQSKYLGINDEWRDFPEAMQFETPVEATFVLKQWLCLKNTETLKVEVQDLKKTLFQTESVVKELAKRLEEQE